jgi:GxxExxY protein
MKTAGKQPLMEGELTRSIIGAFYTVYRVLGFGFMEHIYSAAMEKELTKRGHRVAREVLVAVYYMGERIGYQRMDMLVDDRVVVENKATAQLPPTAEPQAYSYLRGTDLEVGLVLHFGLEPKFRRVVHGKRHKWPRA